MAELMRLAHLFLTKTNHPTSDDWASVFYALMVHDTEKLENVLKSKNIDPNGV
jgi:hypothetical protein